MSGLVDVRHASLSISLLWERISSKEANLMKKSEVVKTDFEPQKPMLEMRFMQYFL